MIRQIDQVEIMKFYKNSEYISEKRYPQPLQSIFDLEDCGPAAKVIQQWPGYEPTPLLRLDRLEKELGVKEILYKDEASRFGLGSFKALGGAYAVYTVIKDVIQQNSDGEVVTPQRIIRGDFDSIVSGITVASATAGNHGRSVAWGAKMFGCGCHIYLHTGVGSSRAEAIARYGAHIQWVEGNYDDAVNQAAADADRHGWVIVSDTSYAGYTEIPKYVMQGYSVMLDEIDKTIDSGRLPTHTFLQGGVGGLASTVCAYTWQKWHERRPIAIVVEPDNADCLYQSAVNRRLTKVSGRLESKMLGMACGQPSLLAWNILARAAPFFLTVPDDDIYTTMATLARGVWHDGPIVAGESGVAGLLGLISVARNPVWREQVGLNENSRILLFGTEGDTDPEVYRKAISQS